MVALFPLQSMSALGLEFTGIGTIESLRWFGKRSEEQDVSLSVLQGEILPDADAVFVGICGVLLCLIVFVVTRTIPRLAPVRCPRRTLPMPLLNLGGAVLFERGLKNAFDASQLPVGDNQRKRLEAARANLLEFLYAARSIPNGKYANLAQRNFQDDVWAAYIALGSEQAVVQEFPTMSEADREKFSLLRIRLRPKLWLGAMEENLQVMEGFLQQFPASSGFKRVQFDAATLSFERGKALCKEADSLAASAPAAAQGRRVLAASVFERFRALRGQVTADKQAGIEESDVRDLREDLLHSFLLEKNYIELARLVNAVLAEYSPGSPEWGMAKFYEGIGLMEQTPPKLAQAAMAFDAILGLGFKNKPDHDKMVAAAARWAVHIARKTGETNQANEVIRWVQMGGCTKHIQEGFLKEYLKSATAGRTK